MKSFRQYLFESQFERTRYQPEINFEQHEHQARIDGVPIHMVFTNQDGNHSIDYSINHSIHLKHSEEVLPETRQKILGHVRNMADFYIRAFKPKMRSIKFEAADLNSGAEGEKAKVYEAFARQMAKKHGGTYNSSATKKSHYVIFR